MSRRTILNMKTNAQRRLNKNVKQSKFVTISTVCQDCRSSYHLKHFLNNNLNRYEVQCQQSFEEVCHTSYEAKTENVCQDSVKEECKIVHDRQCEPVVETKCRLVKDTTV